MIKLSFYTIVSLMMSFQAFGQSWSLGFAGIYGDDIGQMGLHARGYYNLKNDRICLGPEYSLFFESTESKDGEEITRKLNEFNFNIHYIFEIGEGWGIYPLTGLNLSFEQEEVIHNGQHGKEHIQAFGANLGLGIHRSVNRWVLFGEYDHLFSELSQNSFLLGVFYTFGKQKHRDE